MNLKQTDDHDETFEAGLTRGLCMLADHAPAGPTPQQVLAALAKRHAGKRRRSLALAAGFALLAGAGVMFLSASSQNLSPTERDAIAHRDRSLHTFTAPSIAIRPVSPQRGISDPALVYPADSFKPFNAALSITEPVASRSLIAPISADAAAIDWNLTLSLTLASAQPDEAMPVIQFNSTW